jgi:uncharacterized membrane protein
MNKINIAAKSVLQSKFWKIENVFAVIFLFGAVAFAIITPPGQNPDESAHFERVWQLGNFNLFAESSVSGGEKMFGGEQPANISRFFSDNDITSKFDPNHKFNKVNTDETHSLQFNSQTEFQDFRGAGTYSPIAYISMIPGVWIGKLFHLPIFSLFFLLRLLSIVTVLVLFYFAIRIAPIAKWGIFCVGLIPSVLAQSAAISADGITMGATIFFISYVLYIALCKNQLSWKQYLIIGILIFTIGLSKIAYLPLATLLLLIPLLNTKARGWRTILLLLGTLVVCIVPSLIWMGAVSYIDSYYSTTVNVAVQKDFILHNPLSYLHILYINFFTEQNAGMTPVVWLGMFGNFGYLTAPLPTFAVFLLIISLTCSIFLTSRRELKWKLGIRTLSIYRAIIVATLIVCVIAIATALYLYWSPAKGIIIMGLQGRYFIPLLPLLSLFFYGNTLKKQLPIKTGLPAVYMLVTVVALMAAYHRYYL